MRELSVSETAQLIRMVNEGAKPDAIDQWLRNLGYTDGELDDVYRVNELTRRKVRMNYKHRRNVQLIGFAIVGLSLGLTAHSLATGGGLIVDLAALGYSASVAFTRKFNPFG